MKTRVKKQVGCIFDCKQIEIPIGDYPYPLTVMISQQTKYDEIYDLRMTLGCKIMDSPGYIYLENAKWRRPEGKFRDYLNETAIKLWDRDPTDREVYKIIREALWEAEFNGGNTLGKHSVDPSDMRKILDELRDWEDKTYTLTDNLFRLKINGITVDSYERGQFWVETVEEFRRKSEEIAQRREYKLETT